MKKFCDMSLTDMESVRDTFFPMMDIEQHESGAYSLVCLRTHKSMHEELVLFSMVSGELYSFNDDGYIGEKIFIEGDVAVKTAYTQFVYPDTKNLPVYRDLAGNPIPILDRNGNPITTGGHYAFRTNQ